MPILLLFFSSLLVSCGEVGSSDSETELSYNYKLLKAYFYHPQKIKEYKEYEGLEIDSMYSSLGDYFKGTRYTRYYPPSKADNKISEIENTPKYYSFGFERYLPAASPDTLVVWAVYPISPAAAAGLRKRDKLLFANSNSLVGASAALYSETDSLFEASTVFTVLREGSILNLPVMKKEEVKEPTVFLDSLNGIPYIMVAEYTLNTNNPGGTYAEFKEVLKQIKGAKTAIMDVRYNGGGSVYHCTAMAAEMVSLNSELVYDVEHYHDKQRGNVIDTVHYFAKDFLKSEGIGASINWVLLVNGHSASCTERFAAALKYNRPETVIIGETSYGKGIGQIYTKTYLGGLAYITFMQSFYPNGITFHEVGIAPDKPIGSNGSIYEVAIDAAQGFNGLAKRLPILLKDIPPLRKARPVELGMYK